MVEKIEDQNT